MDLSTARYGSYYAGWLIRSYLGNKRPLVSTIIIHYKCNLKCQHCSIAANQEIMPYPRSISFENASKDMQETFDRGARILFFEGGEPTIWTDGDKDLSDLIEEGRRIGYYVIGYTTNGIGKIFEQSDVVSVSLDGPREIHDLIRGPGVFDRLMENLGRTKHTNIFANMVVTRTNIDRVRATAEVVAKTPSVRGMMINFLTPPPYDISLTLEQKKKVVEEVRALKKEGLPIVNSNNALKEPNRARTAGSTPSGSIGSSPEATSGRYLRCQGSPYQNNDDEQFICDGQLEELRYWSPILKIVLFVQQPDGSDRYW